MRKEQKRLGILGGGQLSLMMLEAAQRMRIPTTVFLNSAQEPAARAASQVVIGKVEPHNISLKHFLQSCDVVAFENEFLPLDVLRLAADDAGKFVPVLETMALVQDKLQQKRLLEKLGIATAPFVIVPPSGSLDQWLQKLLNEWPGGYVLKWSRQGYDGRGNFFVTAKHTDFASAARFCAAAQSQGTPVYAELMVPFTREVSLVAAHSTTGELKYYPLVITEQSNGVCRRVIGPATEFGVSARVEAKARSVAETLAKSLPLHGVFAIEFFLSDELLVNEIAPRVHNSGHFSLEASKTSQFENHVRAVMGMKLGDTASAPGFAMLNLLGPSGVAKEVTSPDPKLWGKVVKGYWYEKREVRPGRKMGHLNAVARRNAKAVMKEVLTELEQAEARWVDSLRD